MHVENVDPNADMRYLCLFLPRLPPYLVHPGSDSVRYMKVHTSFQSDIYCMVYSIHKAEVLDVRPLTSWKKIRQVVDSSIYSCAFM